jgi:methyl-accepting chemotaxis protein
MLRIGGFAERIRDITAETKALAVNAAIQAANTDESGKEFGVVAEEVRALSENSRNAAAQISDLVDDALKSVNDGIEKSEETARAMHGILGFSEGINENITSIAEAFREQSSDLGQVSRTIQEMDTVTQQNAAMVEESAATSQAMQDMTQRMALAVSRFDTGAAPQTPDFEPRASLRKPRGKDLRRERVAREESDSGGWVPHDSPLAQA